MSRYARDTTVSAEKSRAEIEHTLVRYGADQFFYGWEQEQAVIGFRLCNRMIRFFLPMPNPNDKEFWRTPARREWRSDDAAHREWEKATRQRWRALLLVIKAKLEAVESNITTIEQEFMAHIVLPDGQTVGQFMAPQIETAYELGQMPSLLALPQKAAQQDTEA